MASGESVSWRNLEPASWALILVTESSNRCQYKLLRFTGAIHNWIAIIEQVLITIEDSLRKYSVM